MTDDRWVLDDLAEARFGSIAAIRAALLTEDVAEFDAAFAANGTSVLVAWRRIALLTEQDPACRRQLIDAAAEIRRTCRPRAGSVPWAELKAELGL
ncbi:MAG TPA: DUF6247 family protein [Pseudonocardiaceae bacterium]|nr:DUF6247 family protein [Pseudonocardiaceae bacterium]